jgi:putative transposase
VHFPPQQAKFDDFIEVFNNARPHEALNVQRPSEMTHCSRICLGRKKISVSTVFASQAVGIEEVQDEIWLVSLIDYHMVYLGFARWSRSRIPSAPKCYPCLRAGPF